MKNSKFLFELEMAQEINENYLIVTLLEFYH